MVGDVAGGAADAAAGIEHPGLACNPGEVHQLAGGIAAHGVEVLQQSQIGGRKVVEVLAGSDQRPLDVPPRQAGRVLVLQLVVHCCTRVHAVIIGGIVMRALTASASSRNRGTKPSMSASSSISRPSC